MNAPFICKVQRPIWSADPDRVLIYNKGRDVFYEGQSDPELRALMGEEFKIFVVAHIDDGGKFVIDGRTVAQDW